MELQARMNPANTRYLGEVHDPENRQISRIFKMADVCSIPGHVGLGLNQAFFWGLPMVTERGNQPPEIEYLRDGENGFSRARRRYDERSAIACCCCSTTTRSDCGCPRTAAATSCTHASIQGMFDGFLSCVLIRFALIHPVRRTATHRILRRLKEESQWKRSQSLNRCWQPASESTKRRLLESAIAVQSWVEVNGYRGYEPFDGLSSPLRAFTFGNLLAERILQQAVRQSPINIRPLIGVKPLDSTKGRGMMAWGYLLLHRSTGVEDYWTKAVECLHWLDIRRSPKFEKHSWANSFDFSSRGGAYHKDDSIIVWTSLIAQAYLEAFEQSQDQWFLDIASSACDWIMSLPRERTDRGNCLSYFAHGQESIHNANMLGAAALARAARPTGRRDYAEVARVRHTL